jgi:acyl carrier protein
MERNEVFEKVKSIVSPFAKNEEALKSIAEGSDFTEDLEVNSARLVDIVIAFEDEFDIEVDDESADKISTVKDAIDLILEKVV